jgi:hypothetical protein
MYFMRQGTVVDTLLDTQLLGEGRSKEVLTDINKSKETLLGLRGNWGHWGNKNNDDGNQYRV